MVSLNLKFNKGIQLPDDDCRWLSLGYDSTVCLVEGSLDDGMSSRVVGLVHVTFPESSDLQGSLAACWRESSRAVHFTSEGPRCLDLPSSNKERSRVRTEQGKAFKEKGKRETGDWRLKRCGDK